MRKRRYPDRRAQVLPLFMLLVSATIPIAGHTATLTIPAGTRIYGVIDDLVTSDPKKNSVGDIINGHVWRNIVVDGQTVIAAGSPMLLRISSLQKRRIAGRKGSVTVQAVSVLSTDGTEIFLGGGYDKEGSERIVLVGLLAGLVLLPLVFIRGKNAELAPGTVFDASLIASANVVVPDDRPPTLRLGQFSDLSVEVLYDEMEEGQRDLPIRITLCTEDWAETIAVTSVNESDIPPIPIEVVEPEQENGCYIATGSVDLKDLAEHFTVGINRFLINADEETDEVILDFEM